MNDAAKGSMIKPAAIPNKVDITADANASVIKIMSRSMEKILRDNLYI